jgi:enediyne biosynthesis protein E4
MKLSGMTRKTEPPGSVACAGGGLPGRSFALYVPALLAAFAMAFGQGIASRAVKPATRAKASGKPWTAHFTDISQSAGLTHPILYGNNERIDYLLESSSGGVAFVDFNNDGYADIFAVSGTRFDAGVTAEQASNRLYRNNRDGTFTDISATSGIRRPEPGWGSGVCIGDFDNNGFDDLFVTYWGANSLYRNKGDGTFEDVAAVVGLKSAKREWSSGCTFVDYDRDGDLDLLISHYVDFDPAKTPKPGSNSFCTWKGVAVACGPRGLLPAAARLYRNDKGRFVDVTVESGVGKAQKTFGMTAVAADFDNDGWPDLYVASDSTPSLYFRNLKNGRFVEEALERGVALNEDGREQAGMGLAIGDYNLDGHLDIFKTHFADDTPILYQNEGTGFFRDLTQQAGLAVETRFVGWGTNFADFDNDGIPDLLAVTGNTYPDVEKQVPGYPYKTPKLLFRGLAGARFEQILGEAEVDRPSSSRGMAMADIDNDGDVDIVIWNRNEPLTLLRNDLAPGTNWLEFTGPIGTRVTANYGTRKQTQEILSQASFYSSNGRTLHFGLGTAKTADLEIRWPDGKTATRKAVSGRVR